MEKTSKQLCKNRQSGEKSESRLTDDRNDVWGKLDKFLFVHQEASLRQVCTVTRKKIRVLVCIPLIHKKGGYL